ncbi:DUF6188 family protein [Kitasatospora sp. NPDC057692]|uniref:DUF6188 family protein n=1 Tax=Kitasatospora sp. NPDC057692 TaxID=3346215 RepID=UPI0036B7D83C
MQNTQNTQRTTSAGDGLGAVLAGRRVTAVRGGDRLDLVLDGPVTVRVAHEFRVTGPTGVGLFYPALTFRPTGPLLALVGRTVGSARITPAGGLELAFTGGDGREGHDGRGGGTLSVPPHALIAPWRVVTPDGTVCAGLPGGEVSCTGEPGALRPPGRPRSW